MKKYFIFLFIIFFILITYLSIFKIPEGKIGVSGKRTYTKGFHIKPFFKRVFLFNQPFIFKDKRELLTKEGAKINLILDIYFKWDEKNLWENINSQNNIKEFIDNLKFYDQKNFKKEIEEFFNKLPIYDFKFSYFIEGELPFEIKEKFKPTGCKIFFFALDALDWVMLDYLFDKGKLPNFQRLKKEGAYTTLLSYNPLLSPIIWTSIATSRTPEEHGILEFTIKDPYTHEDIPVTSSQRKVPAFWNILTAFDLKTNLVGWWATFPAEKIKGNIISERLFFHLFGIEPEKKVKGNTYPEKLEEKYEKEIVRAEDIKYEEISRYLNISKEEYDERWEKGKKMENPFQDPVNHLRKILAVTNSAKKIAFRLLEESDFDIFAFYLEGPDTVAHRFAHCIPPKLPWVPEEEYERGKNALAFYYKLIDEILGEILKYSKEDWIISVASDHGFYTTGARPSVPPDDFGGGASQWHRMTGVWIIKGRDIKKGEFFNADIYDITPTHLALIGVPLSKDMKGKVIKEIFLRELDVKYIPSYDFIPKVWREEKTMVVDKERIKELQALGYISPPKEKKEEEKKDFTYYYNLGTTFFQNNEFLKAEEAYKKAIEIYPNFSLGLAGLASVYEKLGKFNESYIYAKRALPYEKDFPDSFLKNFADYAILSKNSREALNFLKSESFGWEKRPIYYTVLGMLSENLGEDSINYYKKALNISPSEPYACERLLGYYLKIKDFDGAAHLLKNAWDSSEGNLKLMNSLGIVCLKNGQVKIAEDIFKTLLKSNPKEPNLIGNLSIALLMQKRKDEAKTLLKEALRLNPKDSQLLYNYGMALEEMGNFKDALIYYEKAKELKFSGYQLYNALGRVYLRVGKKMEAKDAFKNSLKINPEQEDIKKLLSQIEN